MNEVQVTNNPERRRFEVQVGDEAAVLTYRQAGSRITLIHTEVPEALGGRGIGGALARTALEYARAQHLRVVPLCPFVRSYLQSHPQYQDLVDGPFPAE